MRAIALAIMITGMSLEQVISKTPPTPGESSFMVLVGGAFLVCLIFGW